MLNRQKTTSFFYYDKYTIIDKETVEYVDLVSPETVSIDPDKSVEYKDDINAPYTSKLEGRYLRSGDWFYHREAWTEVSSIEYNTGTNKYDISYERTAIIHVERIKGRLINKVRGYEKDFPDDGIRGEFWYTKGAEVQTDCDNLCQVSTQGKCARGCENLSQQNEVPTQPFFIKLPDDIQAKAEIKIKWGMSSDINLDPITYSLERSVNNRSYSQIYHGSSTEFLDTMGDNWRTVRYRVRAHDDMGASDYVASRLAPINYNIAPSTPSYISLPRVIKATRDISVMWGNSIDPEGETVKYELYRSLDNDIYIKIYEGSDTAFSDNIARGSTIVKYRVRATDGERFSNFKTSVTKTVINNEAPFVGIYNENYITRREPFDMIFKIDDPDESDNLRVEIRLYRAMTGGWKLERVLQPFTNMERGVELSYRVPVGEFHIGRYRVDVIVRDPYNVRDMESLFFTKENSKPTISGFDADMGDLEEGFIYTYEVSDMDSDIVNVKEYLNDNIINERHNIDLDTPYDISISTPMLKRLPFGQTAKLKIQADDGKAKSEPRIISFRKKTKEPELEFPTSLQVSPQGFSDMNYRIQTSNIGFTVEEILEHEDGRHIYSKKFNYDGMSAVERVIKYTREEWLKFKPGSYILRIIVTDSKLNVTEKIFKFDKDRTKLIVQLAQPIETDVAAQKAIANVVWYIAPGATGKIEVTNNAFDDDPVWEDATNEATEVFVPHTFTNRSKTATKWGFSMRVTIEPGTSVAKSVVNGIAGAIY